MNGRTMLAIVMAVLAAGPSASAAAAAPAPAPAAGTVTGKVLETVDSGGYTYMRLRVGSRETWAAVNAAKVKKGATVTVVDAIPMDGFESSTLHRKFEHIVFGALARSSAPGRTAGGGPASGQMPAGHPDASDPRFREMMAAQHAAAAQGPAEGGEIRVPKAGGAEGRTVAEIFANRQALRDKPVAVRGKVVKSLSGIMGRNWLHLRDGSGTAALKNNDLAVTTADTAVLGDIVTIRGIVRIDRDFGAGYSYPVLVEEAKVKK
jgi:hypothetical protein